MCSIYEYDPYLECFEYENCLFRNVLPAVRSVKGNPGWVAWLFTPTSWRLCVPSVFSLPFPSHRRWKADTILKPIPGLIGPLVFFSTRLLNGVDAVNLISQTASVRCWSSVNATIKRVKRLFLGDLELLNDEFDSKRWPNCRVCADVITFC